MSARSARGASERQDLFGPANGTGINLEQKNSSEGKQGQYDEGDANGIVFPDKDPLQLEHMLGFAGNYRSTVLCLPNDESTYVKSMGALISVESLKDVHSQRFLRAHDMQVSCLALSKSGKLLASGQVGTKNFKGLAAPIFIWDMSYPQPRRVNVLRGITSRVNVIDFSPDERFVIGCGEDSLIYLWDASTGEVIYGQRVAHNVSLVKWVDCFQDSNRCVCYELTFVIGSTVYKGILSFEQLRVQWQLKMTPYQMPGANVVRFFEVMEFTPDLEYAFCGTTGGEITILRRGAAVFRSLIPVCSNGVRGIVCLDNETLMCGGGDGTIKKLRGKDTNWSVSQETKLPSPVLAMSLCKGGLEVIVSCASGSIYRCSVETLAFSVVDVSHTRSVSCINFGSNPSVFCTGTQSGELRMWDLTDYACQAMLIIPAAGAALAVAMVEGVGIEAGVMSGWENGTITCHDLSLNRQLWIVPGAHRGGCTSLAVQTSEDLHFFVSGGTDGNVRVWRMSNRQLVVQFSEHHKSVAKVLVDLNNPQFIHSVGVDCSVLSYDMKANRKVISHIVNGGMMHDMTQRRDGEFELITVDASGRLLHWDCDIRDPVLSIQDPGKVAIRCCAVSPSGRFMAFAGDDMIVKVINLHNSEIISLGQGHSDSVQCMSWTPDERQLVTGGADFSMCVWNFYMAN